MNHLAEIQVQKTDRTTDPDGEGLYQLALTGVLAITFNPKDRRPQVPHFRLRW